MKLFIYFEFANKFIYGILLDNKFIYLKIFDNKFVCWKIHFSSDLLAANSYHGDKSFFIEQLWQNINYRYLFLFI